MPVMASLESLLQLRSVESVSIHGLRLHHVSYHGLDNQMNFKNSALYVASSTEVTVVNCEFSHVEMSGLFISGGSNILVDRNVFTDIGMRVWRSQKDIMMCDRLPRDPQDRQHGV